MMFSLTVPATALFVLLAGMAILAIVDLASEVVHNWSTAALACFVIAALLFDGITAEQWLAGSLTASAVFAFHLFLGTRGQIGGGDVKLSPVPALVLGAVHPLLALWAVAFSFASHSAVQLSTRPTAGTAVALPFVPSMFVGAGAATVLAGALIPA